MTTETPILPTPCRRETDIMPAGPSCNKPETKMTKPQKMLRAFSSALWDTDLIASRMTLAFGEFCWAVMLLWPGESFDRPTYHHMATIMNENAWGLLFALSAGTQLTIILMDDMHSRFARYFACWNACLWLYTVWAMLASIYPPPAAIGGEIALATAAVWVWIRPYILAQGYANAIANT